MSQMSRGNSWNAEERLTMVLDSYGTDNVAAFCRERGLDRSYLYQLRGDLQETVLEAWAGRGPGRPPQETDPARLLTELEAARQTIQELELATRQLTAKCEVQGLLLGFAEHNAKKKPSGRRRGST
jgi:hypothetical protein